jgi:hypothetical protein
MVLVLEVWRHGSYHGALFERARDFD